MYLPFRELLIGSIQVSWMRLEMSSVIICIRTRHFGIAPHVARSVLRYIFRYLRHIVVLRVGVSTAPICFDFRQKLFMKIFVWGTNLNSMGTVLLPSTVRCNRYRNFVLWAVR